MGREAISNPRSLPQQMARVVLSRLFASTARASSSNSLIPLVCHEFARPHIMDSAQHRLPSGPDCLKLCFLAV